MRPDGSDRRRVTHDDVPDESDVAPDCSPDSSLIAFVGAEQGQEAYLPTVDTIAPEGTGLRRLTPLAEFATDLPWSPDRTTIAFGFGAPGAVSFAHADGSAPTGFILGGIDRPAAWSPDGTTLAVWHFRYTVDGNSDGGTVLMDAAGRPFRALYPNRAAADADRAAAVGRGRRAPVLGPRARRRQRRRPLRRLARRPRRGLDKGTEAGRRRGRRQSRRCDRRRRPRGQP
jgi:hypothetical protein